MASEEFRVELTADNEISDEARDAAKALDQIPDKVEVSIDADTGDTKRDLDQIMEYVDRLGSSSARIVLQDNAKSIQTDITNLLVDIDRLDANDPQVTIKIDQINELEGQLGTIEAKVDSLGSREIDIQTGSAKRNVDDLGKSADSSKSVLANMVGNSVQDLGALGGIAGSAGVAIGQMGEYMVDAANSGDKMGDVLRNFASVAGPIAALVVGVSALSSILSAQNERTERAAATTKQFGDAMADAGDDAVGLADSLRENIDSLQEFNADSSDLFGGFVEGVAQAVKAIPLIGGAVGDAGQNITDVAKIFDKLGISVYDIGNALKDGGAGWDNLAVDIDAAREAGQISDQQWSSSIQLLTEYRDAAVKASEGAKLLNVSQDEANAILQDMVAQKAPLEQFTDLWATLLSDIADGSIDTDGAADAINQLAENLGLTREQIIALAQEDLAGTLDDAAEAADAAREKYEGLVSALDAANDGFVRARDAAGLMSNALDTFNTGSDLNFSAMASDTVESFDSLKGALREVQELGSKPLVPTAVEDLRGLSDESAAVIQSLGGMRDAIQTELVAAMDAGGGSFSSFTEKAGFFRQQVLEQFPSYFEGLGLSSEDAATKTQEVLSALGLLPEQVATQIKLEGDELALQKIGLFGSAIDDLPAEVQAKVVAAIDEGNPQEAWQLIKAGVEAEGAVEVPTTADTSGAQASIDEVTGQEVPPVFVDIEGNADPAEETADEFTRQQRTTEPVQVDASTAIAAGILLAFLTQPRKANIYVDVPNANAAFAVINAIASQARTATIGVSAPNADNVDRQLDQIASQRRDAVINVTTNQTTVLRRVDGGG